MTAVEARARSAWPRWRDRIDQWVLDPSIDPILEFVHFNDLVLAAAGRLPSRLLARDLRSVTRTAWSELALAGIASQWARDAKAPVEYVPLWAPLAALRALGFSRDALISVYEEPLPPGADPPGPDRLLAFTFVETAGAAPAGFVAISEAAILDIPAAGPYLMVNASALAAYRRSLDWLARNGIVGTVIYDRG